MGRFYKDWETKSGGKMSFGEAINRCLTEYATFGGRAARSEYWYFFLFTFLVSAAANILDAAGETQVVGALAALALLIPSIAVAVRRLHDRDKSGWWYLLVLIPLIGAIILLVWFVQRGTVGPNRFGSDPLQ